MCNKRESEKKTNVLKKGNLEKIFPFVNNTRKKESEGEKRKRIVQ